MKYAICHTGARVALVAAAFAAANAFGQTRSPSDPADANVQVSPTRYEALVFTPVAPASAQSPADNWKALNRTVGSYDSMSLTMDAAQSTPAEGKATEMSTAPPSAQTPASHAGHVAPAAAPTDPQAGHRSKEVR